MATKLTTPKANSSSLVPKLSAMVNISVRTTNCYYKSK